MSHNNRPLLSALQAELGSLLGDVREMAELRWRLARLELDADVYAAKRLAVVMGVAALGALTSLPVLVVASSCLLDGVLDISQGGWLGIIGLVLLVVSVAAAAFAWHKFRRNLIAFEETREELREDMVWLRELRDKEEVSGEKTNVQ